ncbi:MAG TPA: cytochrome c oxidase assembly factor Coa1 family protein [Pyrinomonadaceae bacterium]
MTTKKIVVIVVSVVVLLGLLVLIVAGGIVGVAFYSIGNSEAANVGRAFLRENEKLKQDIGEVKDFGSWVTGNININNGDGRAELNFKVIGENKEVNATVELAFRSGSQWRVTAASYRNETGERIELLNPYDSRLRGISGPGFTRTNANLQNTVVPQVLLSDWISVYPRKSAANSPVSKLAA